MEPFLLLCKMFSELLTQDEKFWFRRASRDFVLVHRRFVRKYGEEFVNSQPADILAKHLDDLYHFNIIEYPICKSHKADLGILLQVLRPTVTCEPRIFLLLGYAIPRGYCGVFDQHPVSLAMNDWGFHMNRTRLGLPLHLITTDNAERAMIIHFLTPHNSSRPGRDLCTERVMLLIYTHPNEVHRVHERLMFTEHREDNFICCSVATASICEIAPYMAYVASVREFQFTSLMPPRLHSTCGNSHFRSTPLPVGFQLR